MVLTSLSLQFPPMQIRIRIIFNLLEIICIEYRAYNSSDTSGYSNETFVSESVLPVELSLFTIEISQNDNSGIFKNGRLLLKKTNSWF